MRTSLGICLLLAVVETCGAADTPAPPDGKVLDKVLFDFESPDELRAWANLDGAADVPAEPPARLERSSDQATSGSSSLKITFAGGTWPTITTTQVPGDWTAWETFRADVTASRPCVAGFTVLQEGSKRGGGYEKASSRWTKTAFLQPGKNVVTAPLRPRGYGPIRPQSGDKVLGPVVRFEFFMYQPHDGEVVYVDDIRLTGEKLPPDDAASNTSFRVLGTDRVVSGSRDGGVRELGRQLADQWVDAPVQTVDQAEADFRSEFDRLRANHPRAVLAVFRDGERGFDPARPERVYAGWQDAYWSSHGPDGLFVERSTNYGREPNKEIFMRHRSPLMRADLSSIPPGSNILAARLLVVRESSPEGSRSPHHANMWVAEACNRPWKEYEVNAFEYAKDRFWKEIGGRYYGDDPDFLPLYLAHGPGREGCNAWDFTHAVRHWTDGRNENHGFMLHGDAADWFMAWYREAEEIKNRPALLVVYEPQ